MLARVPIFAALNKDQLAGLARLVVRRSFPRGTVIIREGDTEAALYIIAGGQVSVTKRTLPGSPDLYLATLNPGDFVGEMALLDGAPRRFEMPHISETTPSAKRLTDVLLRAANEIKAAVADMRKPQVVNQHVGLIKRMEEEGDAIYHEAVGALFAGKPDPIEVIKWKEMYDTLEHAIDSCMGVAQVLQSISLKNA